MKLLLEWTFKCKLILLHSNKSCNVTWEGKLAVTKKGGGVARRPCKINILINPFDTALNLPLISFRVFYFQWVCQIWKNFSFNAKMTYMLFVWRWQASKRLRHEEIIMSIYLQFKMLSNSIITYHILFNLFCSAQSLLLHTSLLVSDKTTFLTDNSNHFLPTSVTS